MSQSIRPVMLVVLDGFGWREESADNAVRQASKPAFDRLWRDCPHAFLRTSGRITALNWFVSALPSPTAPCRSHKRQRQAVNAYSTATPAA